MKKIILLVLLISVNANASIKFWCPSEPGTLREPKPVGIKCFQVDSDSFNPEIVNSVGDDLLVDEIKLAAYNAKVVAESQVKQDRLNKIAACESIYRSIDSASNAQDLKAMVKCLVKDAR